MKSSEKRRSLVGNIANQKYEASRNIERHIQIIHHTQPTPETTRWRSCHPYYFMKQEGRLVVEEKLLNKDNAFINKRLHMLANENRQHAHELAPGWRSGKGIQSVSILTNTVLIIIYRCSSRRCIY